MSAPPTIQLDPTTRWWHRADDGKVVCTLCPRECHIPLGSRGFCFVRANEGGELQLTTYGRSSGFCIDPIEKKPLNHFLPGTPVLSLGTAGCNLGCKFCQNWDISKSRQMDTLAGQATPEQIVTAAKRTGCRSIAFTYNDPVIWAEYAIDIARIARAEGIKTVAVTAGYISPDARREFYQWMDAANVDLKAFTETFYRKLTQTQLAPVLDTLRYLKHETNVWFEITNLIIPGENDSADEIDQMSDWVLANLGDDVPMHFSAFHPDFKMMDTPRTPDETLLRARQQAIDKGIKFAYVGNMHNVAADSTYCPSCGHRVIERDWYELGEYQLDGNRCTHCNSEIPGVFDQGCGDWGRKRVPLNIHQERVELNTRVVRKSTPPMEPISVKPNAHQAVAPKIDFSDEQTDTILNYTRAAVNAAVRTQPIDEPLAADIADAPAYGVFVTLKRPAGMRACRGRWGSEYKLGQLLHDVAQDAAVNDYRFARIAAPELDRLGIDVSIMHSPEPITAAGEARIEAVKVGRDGLVITHPRGRGLLLPNVATEAGWNARTFLEQVAIKAGLPKTAWQDDAAELMTFQTRLVSQDAPVAELDVTKLTPQRLSELCHAVNVMVLGDAPPGDVAEALSRHHDEELGLYVLTESGLNATALGPGHSLMELAELAAQSFKDMLASRGRSPEQITRLAILWQPVRLHAADYPNRHQLLRYHAVLARDDGRWSLALPRPNQPGDTGRHGDQVGEALAQARINAQQWRIHQTEGRTMPRLTAFNVLGFNTRRHHDQTAARPAARAGQFYPAGARDVAGAVDMHMAKAHAVKAKPHRAVMLPHAGWRFCGDTIAKTIARVKVPDLAVVIGPNHTGVGPTWSVASHNTWELPGISVPIDTDAAEFIADRTPAMQCEPNAHRMEHGTEVLLPFLHKANPAVRVVPIVLGHTSYEQTAPLAAALAELIERGEVLLVISSDMNHFAPEPENRRLDHLALDAMLTGDPRELYDTCTRNQISMCGMIPAVTIMQALLARNGKPLKPELIDYTNSAQATGDTTSVVGYAGVVIE